MVDIDTKGIYGTPRSTIELLEKEGRFSKLAIQRTVWRLHKYKYEGYNPDDDKPKEELLDTDKNRKLNQLRAKFFENYGYHDITNLIFEDNQKYFEIAQKWNEFKKTLPDE